MLSDLPSLKAALRIQQPASGRIDGSQDAYLTSLLPIADAVVKRFCKRDLETQVYVSYPRVPTATTDLPLDQRPLRLYQFTGVLTSGSPTVTGLTIVPPPAGVTASTLLAGMPAMVSNATANALTVVPSGTTVLTVDSATQVTLTANATMSGTFAIWFGLAVWLDPGGRGGFGPGAFAANTQLLLGVDYIPKVDQKDGSSKSGLLTRLGGGPSTFGMDFWYDRPRGTLTARMPPVWPGQWGVDVQAVKVVYTAGLGIGAAAPTGYPPAAGMLPSGTALPPELTYCTNAIAGWIRTMMPVGTPLDVSALSPQVDRLLSHDAAKTPEVAGVRRILLAYRETSF